MITGGQDARVAKCAQVLGGIEAESCCGAKAPGPLSIPGCAYCLRGIFNHFQLELSRNPPKRLHVCTMTVKVNRHHRRHICRNHLQAPFYRIWIEIQGLRIDIGKYRTGSGASDGTCRSEKAERRGDDGIAWFHSGSHQPQPERVSTRCTTDSLTAAAQSCKFLFESCDFVTQNVFL